MKASGTSLLFEQKGVPFESIDAFFDGLKGAFEDGFVLARSNGALRYFFVIQGKPYIAAVIDGDAAGVTSIEDFFAWYRGVETADIEVYRADKKVLLCLLVRIHYSPELSFTTDMMAPEEIIENMEGKGKDAVIAVSDAGGEGGLWHFVIFVGGKVAYTTLLSEGGDGIEEESPADRLISYIMNAAKGTPLLIEIYVETKITQASDAKAFEDGSITGQYPGLAAEAPPVAEALPTAEAGLGAAPEPVPEADGELGSELEIAGPDTLSNEELTPDGAQTPDGALIDEKVTEDISPEDASPLELGVVDGVEEPFMESTDEEQERGASPEPEPEQESESLCGDPAEKDLEEAVELSAEEPDRRTADDDEGFPEELLEEVSAELTTEEGSFSAEPLPDEFAELSMEELSESFDLPGGDEAGRDEGEEDLLRPETKDEGFALSGNAPDVREPVKGTGAGVEGPEDGAGVEEPGDPLTGNAPQSSVSPEGSLMEEAPFSEDEGFTLEDNSSVGSDVSSTSFEEPLLEGEDVEDIIEDFDDNGLDTAFDLDDSAGFTEDTPDVEVEKSGDGSTHGLEDASSQEGGQQDVAAKEVVTQASAHEGVQGGGSEDAADEAVPEEKMPSEAPAVPKDSSFKPLPIEEGMGQRQPKAHPLTATLTGKDGVVFTLGGITNIGKEEGSEIKLDGMLAARRLAAIIRGKDSFKVVKKGGGKAALKVNGDKVDGELELKDGDTLEVGNLSLKFSVVKS